MDRKDVKITVLRITRYPDLMEVYENPWRTPAPWPRG